MRIVTSAGRVSASLLILASSSATPTSRTDDVPLTISTLQATELRQSNSHGVCEARTINYLTHTLPQLCLTTSWQRPAPTVAATSASQQVKSGSSPEDRSFQDDHAPTRTNSDSDASESQAVETAATTFMSFEDWKEMMLRRAGQDPQDLRARKLNEHHTSHRYPSEVEHAELGEEGEISLNFETFGDGEASPNSNPQRESRDVEYQAAGNAPVHESGTATSVYLSKDAGKTCKERFSFSSFDAGATVLKTSPGAKNAKAILVENKDTYMLLECDAESKYVIVELSDDISIDTVVLANFEFFSSMIRHFRVSVSDRYPVKIDKWRELGTFEARNSRDVQPFLVQNPQIWAKYVRIEFLTHFGNEYYCPISLLRIHGTRMLDSWKDSESTREEETTIEIDDSNAHHGPLEASGSFKKTQVDAPNGQLNSSITLWRWPFGLNGSTDLAQVCPAHQVVDDITAQSDASLESPHHSSHFNTGEGISSSRSKNDISSTKSHSVLENRPNTISVTNAASSTAILESSPQEAVIGDGDGNYANSSSSRTTSLSDRPGNATTTVSKSPASSAQSGKSRSTGTLAASNASPTMQEGFFNAITKRLQQVESNLTLSMKYVEDHSKHLQEALQAGEQKQQARVQLFLDYLNKTVLDELRGVVEQYDQMWQSTVLALESQKDRSERDMMALSTRLNLLADEVVFQKRMAIVQAIILLSCLFLIIFSRGVSLPSLAPLLDQVPVSAIAVSTRPADGHPCRDDDTPGASHRDSGPPGSPSKSALFCASNNDETFSSVTDINTENLRQHTADNISTSSVYQRLSPPLSPTLSRESGEIACSSDFAPDSINGNVSRLPGAAHGGVRKPLPSLPEHPSACET